MTDATSRALLAVALVAFALAGTAGSVGATPTTATTMSAHQQPLLTEVDLQASVSGEVVVVAGWFELTASAGGRLDTRAEEADLESGFDVDLVRTLGEFAYRGEVVGTVNASRVLFAFEGNASSLTGGESATPPTASSAAGDGTVGAGGASRVVGVGDTNRVVGVGDTNRVVGVGDTNQAVGLDGAPAERTARQASLATAPATPLQISPFRSLGVSFFDVYWQLATLVLGLLVVGALPNFSRRVADLGAGDPVRTGGAGLAVVLVVPVALLVLGLSLFGIPLAVAGTAVYLVLWWLGAVYGRFTVGLWLLGAVSRGLAAVDVDVRRVENRWVGLLVGTFVVGLLVVLPVVGPVIESLVLLLGLGAVTRLAYGSYRRTERVERARTVDTATGSDDAVTETEEG